MKQSREQQRESIKPEVSSQDQQSQQTFKPFPKGKADAANSISNECGDTAAGPTGQQEAGAP